MRCLLASDPGRRSELWLSLSFTNGEATASVTAKQAISNAGTGATLTVSDGTHSGSTSFDVQNAGRAGWLHDLDDGRFDEDRGQRASPANLSAFDAYGNVNKTYTSRRVPEWPRQLARVRCLLARDPVATPTYGGTLTFANGTASPRSPPSRRSAPELSTARRSRSTDSGASVSNSTSFDVDAGPHRRLHAVGTVATRARPRAARST